MISLRQLKSDSRNVCATIDGFDERFFCRYRACLIFTQPRPKADIGSVQSPSGQYQRPRPCQATPATIIIATSIIVIAVMMLRYVKHHMFDIQRYTDRAILRIVMFFG